MRPSCGVFSSPPPAIAAVVTECRAPGCTAFVAQSNPPVTITGAGFGTFPNGVPFIGTSNYLRIMNTTRGWSAGYTGDACSVSICSCDTGRIQLTPNIPRNGLCQIGAGDSIQVEVWNPQTMVSASFATTALLN